MKQLSPAVAFHPNPIVQYFGKPASEFTREDIIEYIEKYGVRMLNFRYTGEDGRLKMLNFVINNKKHLEEIKDDYLKGVQFHFVKTIMDVLDIALLKTKVEKAVKIG